MCKRCVGLAGVLLCTAPVLVFGQPNFTAHDLAVEHKGPFAVVPTDMDGDGDMDAVVLLQWQDTIRWYENDGMPEPRFEPHDISTTLDYAECVEVADLDGDGDLDVLVAQPGDGWGIVGQVRWFENDGDENFTPRIIDNAADGATDLSIIDLDGDGHLDVLVAYRSENEVRWYENDGALNPGFTLYVVASGILQPKMVCAADVDGDGDTDVLCTSYNGDSLHWFENDGAQSFATHLITSTADGAWDVDAVDLDADGDTDLILSSHRDDGLRWFENDGAESPTFTANDISTIEDHPTGFYTVDVDGDGDLDVVSASYADDTVRWHENDGAPDPVFTQHAVEIALDEARTVSAADFNGDGEIDIIALSPEAAYIKWYANDGASLPGFAVRYMGFSADFPTEVTAADINGDGLIDIVASTADDNSVRWFENDGASPPLFVVHDISNVSYHAESVEVVDIDADGHPDVLSAVKYMNAVYWYENDGTSSPSFITHEVAMNAGSTLCARSADVDGDGNLDVLCSSRSDNPVMWYESDGAATPTFTAHVIEPNPGHVWSLYPTDLDGDGDIDVITAEYDFKEIRWYENDGSQNFTKHLLLTTGDFATAVHAADLDGDGDMDIISTSFDHVVRWFKNDGNKTPTFTMYVLSTGTLYPNSISTADINADGLLDVLITSAGDDAVRWFQNNGATPPAFIAHDVFTSADNACSVYAADLDTDGDLDLVSASYGDDSIRWHESDLAIVSDCDADITTTGAGAGDPGYGMPDGQVTGADINYYVNAWVAQDLAIADVTTTGAGAGDPNYGVPDGTVTGADIQYYVNLWVAGCP